MSTATWEVAEWRLRHPWAGTFYAFVDADGVRVHRTFLRDDAEPFKADSYDTEYLGGRGHLFRSAGAAMLAVDARVRELDAARGEQLEAQRPVEAAP